MSKTIITALAKALPELESAKKNAANPHLKSKYANLSAVMAAVEPIKAYGLWYRQKTHHDPEGACVETIYLHESGEEMSAGVTFVKADKQTPQGFGSALTYCRRYSLQTAFGLDAEDDDGHASSYRPKKEAPPKKMPTGPINDKTRDWLQAQIDSTGRAVGEFLDRFDVQSLKDITYEDMDEVKEWIAKQKETDGSPS